MKPLVSVVNLYALNIDFLTQSETDFILVCEILKQGLFSLIKHIICIVFFRNFTQILAF